MHFSESVSVVPCRMPRCLHQSALVSPVRGTDLQNGPNTSLTFDEQQTVSTHLPGKEGRGTEDALMDDDDLES